MGAIVDCSYCQGTFDASDEGQGGRCGTCSDLFLLASTARHYRNIDQDMLKGSFVPIIDKLEENHFFGAKFRQGWKKVTVMNRTVTRHLNSVMGIKVFDPRTEKFIGYVTPSSGGAVIVSERRGNRGRVNYLPGFYALTHISAAQAVHVLDTCAKLPILGLPMLTLIITSTGEAWSNQGGGGYRNEYSAAY